MSHESLMQQIWYTYANFLRLNKLFHLKQKYIFSDSFHVWLDRIWFWVHLDMGTNIYFDSLCVSLTLTRSLFSLMICASLGWLALRWCGNHGDWRVILSLWLCSSDEGLCLALRFEDRQRRGRLTADRPARHTTLVISFAANFVFLVNMFI